MKEEFLMADFFEKIKDGIGKGVTTASVKSKELIESNKVKGQIDNLEKQRKESFMELGSIVFTMFRKSGFDEVIVNDKCSMILNIDEQVKKKEQELRDIHLKAEEELGNPRPVDTCSCGADVFANTKFCGKCGAKCGELKSPGSIEQVKKNCTQCNTILEPESKFCNACGANCG
jgi:NADH pyrophosphatase NudC (nudix superfamily)